MKALQAIVFDFDGVIADSERLHLRSYQEILAPEGVTISTEAYLQKYLGYDDVGVLAGRASATNRCLRPVKCCFLARRPSSATLLPRRFRSRLHQGR